MPKERRTRSASFERRSRGSPFPCSSSSHHKQHHSSSSALGVPAAKDTKEWEEVRCPVCMEHPHNAVLLLCSSREKGCRPFMCDTSYRHSNCLDQYRKAFSESQPSHRDAAAGQQPTELLCPLCRGLVTGWTALEPARQYLNAKIRSCSMESCGFSGVYGELRKHARKDHPSVRPSEVDPQRQRDWRRLEQQRDIGDLFSMFRSPIGGGEEEDDGIGDDEEFSNSIIPFPSITVFLIVQVTRAAAGGGGLGSSRSSLLSSRTSSLRGSSRTRRGRGMILWGEAFGEPPISNGVDDVDDGGGGGHDSGAEDVSVASRQGQGRRRRQQLRMSDDDSDDEDEFL